MSRTYFYIVIILLAVGAGLATFSGINAAVSLKYEGSESHIAVDMNERLTTEQKAERHRKINSTEQYYRNMQLIYFGLFAIGFVAISVLLYNRFKLSNKKSGA